jgi:dimethylargininase
MPDIRFSHAVVRQPGENFAQGITTSDLGAPNLEMMLAQHAHYVEILHSLGLKVTVLEALPGYPDAHFVEDVAVVTPDVAVITNPGAPARNGEIEFIEPTLAQFREIEHLHPPGTLDGGDVLMVGTHFFIWISDRTNQAGAAQLGRILEKFGNTWSAVPVGAGLHLKSSVNWIGSNTLLLTEDFADHPHFHGYTKLILAPEEEYAGNTLWINDVLITPHGFPQTRHHLETTGLEIIEIEVSECRKMDGGLTCLSLRF